MTDAPYSGLVSEQKYRKTFLSLSGKSQSYNGFGNALRNRAAQTKPESVLGMTQPLPQRSQALSVSREPAQ